MMGAKPATQADNAAAEAAAAYDAKGWAAARLYEPMVKAHPENRSCALFTHKSRRENLENL
jgi:uncharacterized protein with LGFP repeats